jgi:hypothetical protein
VGPVVQHANRFAQIEAFPVRRRRVRGQTVYGEGDAQEAVELFVALIAEHERGRRQ